VLLVENIPAVTEGVTVIIPSTIRDIAFVDVCVKLTSYTYLPDCKLAETDAAKLNVIVPDVVFIDTVKGTYV
jgi:hypothetical protein